MAWLLPPKHSVGSTPAGEVTGSTKVGSALAQNQAICSPCPCRNHAYHWVLPLGFQSLLARHQVQIAIVATAVQPNALHYQPTPVPPVAVAMSQPP